MPSPSESMESGSHCSRLFVRRGVRGGKWGDKRSKLVRKEANRPMRILKYGIFLYVVQQCLNNLPIWLAT